MRSSAISRVARPALVTLAALALVATSIFTPATVRAGTPTVTTLDVPVGVQYGPVTVTGHVRPAPQPHEGYIPAVGFLVNGTLNGAAPLDANGDGGTDLHLPPGTYSIAAQFGPFFDWDASESEPATVTVGIATTVSLESTRNPALNTEPVTITATVTPASGTLSGGTLTIVDAFNGATIASGTVGGGTTSVSVTKAFATGSHELTATYSGDGDYGPSEAALTQVAGADVSVAVSGMGIQYSKFYPVRDGYRDTVAVRGKLGETARAVIMVFSPTGKRVRTADLGTRAAGSYSWAWDGRNGSGTLLAAGKYKIVQRITDGAANVKSATFYVTLSRKKLTWYTHTITRYGAQFDAKGDPGSGWVSTGKSSYGRGVRISSGTSWAAVRYPFTLRAATVYGSLRLRVLGRSPNGTEGWAGLWNRTYGSASNAANYDAWMIGPAYKWYASSFDPGSHRSRRATYGEVVVAWDGRAEVFDIAKVQLTYRYAVLS